MNAPNVYVANATCMWSTLASSVSSFDDVLRAVALGGTRYLVRRRLAGEAIGAFISSPASTGRTVVEDPFGTDGVQVGEDVSVMRMPVMNRGPCQAIDVRCPEGVTVRRVVDANSLGCAERVMVDGFPHRYLQPWIPERALPPTALTASGLTVWLAEREGVPASAGFTYDDGSALGIYWLATLPQHRSAGLGRALMATMLAGHPRRTATLVATDAALSLYRSLGFSTVSMATWYIRTTPAEVPPRDRTPGFMP